MAITPTATRGESSVILELKGWSSKKDARGRAKPGASLAALDCRGLRFGWVDFDAALEVGAVLNADARRGNIADDGAVLLNVDAAACVEVSDDFAVNDHFASVNFRIELRGGTYREFVAVERDRAVDFAVDLQVFGAGDMTFDYQACAQARRTACGGATGARA